MGQPLPVAILRPWPEVAAGDLREAGREAGVPDALGGRLDAVEVGDLGRAGAEAGRADERAVARRPGSAPRPRPNAGCRGRPAAGRGGPRSGPGRRSVARSRGDGADVRRRPRSSMRRQAEACQEGGPGRPSRCGPRSPSSSSVRRRSYPPVTSGPVPIEVQKQVSAGATHSTATISDVARRAA